MKENQVNKGLKRTAAKTGRALGENSRDKILAAARHVFATHPYHMATIRMVGKAGGFDHQLIAYYFPTKAELFEQIVAEACDEFRRANLEWFEGLGRMSLEDGFALYLDRLVERHFSSPDALRIIALNAALIERLDEIPGYEHIVRVLADTRATVEENLPLRASSDKIGRFINTLNSAIITFLGSAPSQAQVLGLDPAGEQYKAWVRETLHYVFLPALRNLIVPGREQGGKSSQG